MSSKKEETSSSSKEEETKEKTKIEKLSTVSYVCVSMTSFTLIYLAGYFNQSFMFVFLLTAAYALYSMKRDEKRMRIEAARRTHDDAGAKEMAAVLESLPSWVRFPDTEVPKG